MIIGGEKIKEGFKIMGIIIKVDIIKEDITKVARTKDTIKEGTIKEVTIQVPRTKDTIKAVTTLMDDKDSYHKIKKKVKDMNKSQNSLL